MLTKDTSLASLVTALAFCGIVASAGVDAYHAMTEKVAAQVAAVDALREWKRQYAQLIPVEERWVQSLQDADQAKDLLAIHQMVGVDASHSNPDKLRVESVERLTEGGKDLGAQKICFNSLGNGWRLTDESFSNLLTLMQTVVARADLRTGALTLSQDKGRAQAVVQSACLLVRDPQSSGSATTKAP